MLIIIGNIGQFYLCVQTTHVKQKQNFNCCHLIHRFTPAFSVTMTDYECLHKDFNTFKPVFLQCFVLEFHVFKEAHLGKWISFIRRYGFTEIHFGNMP